MNWSSRRVLSFDCYGTLIDWERGLLDALRPLFRANGRRGQEVDACREDLLEQFARFETATQDARPAELYPRILEHVHRELAMHLGLASSLELDARFGASVGDWPAFEDSAAALRALQARAKLVILSNVDRASFARSEARLGLRFDAVYTAEEIGSYKPARANFEFLLDAVERDFGAGAGELLHVAQSLFHDHVPAGAAGIERVWIDRQGLAEGGAWGATARLEALPDVEHRFASMADFAAAFTRGD